jgi:hypothetical protein
MPDTDAIEAREALLVRAFRAAEELPAGLVVGTMCHCDVPDDCWDHWELYYDAEGFRPETGNLRTGRQLDGSDLRNIVALVRAMHGEPDQDPELP